MKIKYINKNFRNETISVVDLANTIIDDYHKMDLRLTLRQLYYQFVSRDLIANKQSEYKRLGGIVRDARLAGLIDWESIEDRTRSPVIWRHTETAETAVAGLKNTVAKNLWESQDLAVEVWIEKDALTGVIRTPCSQFDVPYFACKGYNSSSAAWLAGQRINRRDKPTVILHLGDHDPSGIDMTEDIIKRFEMFTGGKAIVERIALNMSQITKLNPPPNPTKMTDSRAQSYVERFGHKCWELDAINPADMQRMITKKIKTYIDFSEWNKTIDAQYEENHVLDELIYSWPEIRDRL